jgi:hypothetical protein
MFDRATTTEPANESARPYRGRRLTWEQFYALRPDLRPANDNGKADEPTDKAA